MNAITQQLNWFGKLPCVGDFCSHNMPVGLQETIDLWLSKAMQEGQSIHGNAWTSAYFQTPVHGFVWGPMVLPHLNNKAALGVIMPSVDKAGRAFPFILLQTLSLNDTESLAFESMTLWFQQAHVLCADALNEDWCLSKLESECTSLSLWKNDSAGTHLIKVNSSHSQWFRIDYNGAITKILQCDGLPVGPDFDTLLGLGSNP